MNRITVVIAGWRGWRDVEKEGYTGVIGDGCRLD